jgi:hypothetical protein
VFALSRVWTEGVVSVPTAALVFTDSPDDAARLVREQKKKEK